MKEPRASVAAIAAAYGPLNSLARHKINTALITQNWDYLPRVAGSLKLGRLSTP